LNYKPAFGSHIPILIKILEQSKGPVLELGMGFMSTPLLYWMTLDQGRKLVSYDNEESWVTQHQKFRGKHNEIHYVEDWSLAPFEVPVEEERWGVALIDLHPEEYRSTAAMRLSDSADYIVLHDSDPKCDFAYKYSNIYTCFTWKYHYTKKSPHTTIVSNFIDVTKLGE